MAKDLGPTLAARVRAPVMISTPPWYKLCRSPSLTGWWFGGKSEGMGKQHYEMEKGRVL
jgi:hypothetical protein